jgi:hypothetical protein
MSLHHLANHIDYGLEDPDGHTEEEIVCAALDKYVDPILTKTLDMIYSIEHGSVLDMHQVRLLKDEINDLLQGKFR